MMKRALLAIPLMMAASTIRGEQPSMSVEDYARTASRSGVMANVCPQYFKLNVEQMRQWQRIAIEEGKRLSRSFDAILAAEVKRRNAEVDRTGHQVWCVQMRGQYQDNNIDIEAPTRPELPKYGGSRSDQKAGQLARQAATFSKINTVCSRYMPVDTQLSTWTQRMSTQELISVWKNEQHAANLIKMALDQIDKEIEAEGGEWNWCVRIRKEST